MYSYEIKSTLEKYQYDLPSDLYMHICATSPQINHIKYNPYGDYFEIWTNDDNYWKFSVHLKES